MITPRARTHSPVSMEPLEPRLVLAVIDGLPTISDLETPTNPVVVLETDLGDIYIELFPQDAPGTVDNFIEYVNRGLYGESLFHRSQPGFVLQGGGFAYTPDLGLQGIFAEDLGPIVNEFGRSNLARTIAMAKSSDPDSATSQFFFNLVNNPGLDNPGNSGGFTVFGRVITNASWTVVQNIVALDIEDLRNDDALEDQLVDRSGNLLFRTGGGFLTTVDTGMPAFGNTAFGSNGFSSGGFPVNPSFDGTFADGDEVEILNAQLVKPEGDFGYFDELVAIPEGFRSPKTYETLSLENSNDFEVVAQVVVRYERGVREEVIFSGVVNANESLQVVLHDPLTPADSLVRPITPYAIEVYTAAEAPAPPPVTADPDDARPVAASFTHLDFGDTLGDSGSYQTGLLERSTTWDFPSIPIGNTDLPYLVWQNIGDEDTTVTVRFFGSSFGSFTRTFDLEAYRRGGLEIWDNVATFLENQPAGTQVSARVTATTPIVVGLSAYRPVNGGQNDPEAEGVLGQPGAAIEGAAAGVSIPATASSFVTALNATNSVAVITLVAFRSNGTFLSVTPPQFIMTANSRASVDLANVFPTIPTGEVFTLRFNSTTPVALEASVRGGITGNRTRRAFMFDARASSIVHFADVRLVPGSPNFSDRISVFNPFANSGLDVVLDFRFSDGTVISSSTISLLALGRTDVSAASVAAVLAKANAGVEFQQFSVTVRGAILGTPAPLVASLSRIDSGSGNDLIREIASAGMLDSDITDLDDPIFDPGSGS
ncbi:MAG: peptidylprolyl isomerase [Phycisphaeraceae bacterium]|nr:peptidylprolyl isomerase [Phycisphaeraceae bacterium]